MSNIKTKKVVYGRKKFKKKKTLLKYNFYEKLSEEKLIEASEEILKKLSNKDERDIVDLDERYKIILEIMENKIMDKYSYDMEPKIYPDYEDPNFNEKIFKKKEFYLNKISKKSKLSKIETENKSKQLCDPLYGIKDKKDITFKLTENQKFLKAFLSPETPYNGMLLFHGTGVGKTCTSISIAEQYTEEIKKYNKKIFIILNPSIEANFRKNIFNIEKIKQGLTNYQCTGDKYLNELNLSVDDLNNIDKNKLGKKINKLINSRYKFFGYIKFANYIKNLDEKIKKTYGEELYPKMIKKKIRDIFSNSVLIIDEVHNIKDLNEKTSVPPMLNKVVDYAENMKLLLLSATPMFNEAAEIIFLINLLLRNDNKPLLDEKKFFSNQKFNMKNKDLFLNKIRGYVSFMRGEDPYRFPKRKYHNKKIISLDAMPKLSKENKRIVTSNRIKDLKIIGCKMKGFQLEIYKKLIEDKQNYGEFGGDATMVSNIVFPVSDDINNTTSVKTLIGDSGFDSVIDLNKVNRKNKYVIKDPEHKDMFLKENIGNYSCKIEEVISNIEKSKGIVFVYSQYKKSGVIPLALALEHAGYSKYDESLINDKVPNKGKYIIISGDNELSKKAYEEYIKIQDENINGEKVKIILGTKTATEGLDFSFIRQVHIFDPWFHLNKLDQVIGRAIRNCSHIKLRPEDRNVTIFLYAAITPNMKIETIDIDNYRKAELKSAAQAEVEYLLKTSAVDCNLNINGNKFENDVDGSRKCNYKDCDFKCIPRLSDTLKPEQLNNDTINKKMLDDNVNEIVREILNLYKEDYYFTTAEIIDILKKDKLLIFLALNKIVRNKINVLDKRNHLGNILYQNKNYIFVKQNMSNFLSINNIRRNTKKLIGKINFSKNAINSCLTTKTKNFSVGQSSKKTNSKPKKDKTIADFIKEGNNLTEYDNYLITESAGLADPDPENKAKVTKIKAYLDNIRYFNTELKIKIILNKLTPADKEKFSKELIVKHNKKSLTEKESEYLNNLSTIMYVKNDVYFEDPLYDGLDDKEIWGYKRLYGYGIKYIKYDKSTNKFIEAEPVEIKQIEKSIYKKFQKLKENDLLGYYEYNPKKQEINFKIRDKLNDNTISDRKTGSICNSDGVKKVLLFDYIKKLCNKDLVDLLKDVKKKTKTDLCSFLELTFILKNDVNINSKNIVVQNKRFFFNPEETYEYKRYSKK